MSSAEAPKKLWFLFFVRDSGPRPKEVAELEKMQDRHIQNLKSRYAEGHFLAAGPLQDPSKFRRGIVIALAANQAEIQTFFAEDPYVQGHIMRVEAHPWIADQTQINLKLPDPDGIAEYRLAMLTLPKSPTASLVSAHQKRLNKATPRPGIFGFFDNASREILLFNNKDTETIRTLLANDPLTKTYGGSVDVMPLWMGKDIIK